MQRKAPNKVQMIHHQLTGPTIVSRLECLALHPKPLCSRCRPVFLELDMSDMTSRVTREIINIWEQL